jgi:magnesium transporter
MSWLLVQSEAAVPLDVPPRAAAGTGFHWLDLTHEELRADPERVRATIAALAGASIDELHLRDAANLQHPSNFGATADYRMLIFRELIAEEEGSVAPLGDIDHLPEAQRQGHRLQPIATRPVAFFLFDRLLLTVRSAASQTVDQVRQRLLEARPRTGPASTDATTFRLPRRPEELMLRVANAMVDRYLGLRQPLTERLDRWQRELLDRRRPFDDWPTLLEARIQLRRLQSLCEEQRDALQELRDEYLDDLPEERVNHAFLVRVDDIIEHIERVLSHAERLENSIDSAVQLHFSAMAHRTNQVMRVLTVITAIFAPLTLIAGLWGMNFESLPGARHPNGFALMVGTMIALTAMLLFLLWVWRALNDRPGRTARRDRLRPRRQGPHASPP